MLKNFRRGFNGNYRVKLTPGKLRTFCRLDKLWRIVWKNLPPSLPFVEGRK
jgi:hypothetical protein